MRILYLTLTALIAAALPAPAQAQAQAPGVNASYGLYTGGARMIDVDTHIDLSPNTYVISTNAATRGLFARLLPWQGNFKTTGAKNFQPKSHDYTVNWRKDSETLSFAYAPAGTLKSVTEIKSGTGTDKTPDDMSIAAGTRDLLSTIALLLSHFEKTGDCTLDTLTFDGKRSLTVQTRNAGQTTLNNPALSTYTGAATGCSVKIIPQKGDWPKKPRGWLRIQQMGESDNRLPVIWLAKPDGAPHPIPVRIDIFTKYGNVIAHLQGLNQTATKP